MIAFYLGPVAVSVYGLLLSAAILGALVWTGLRFHQAGYEAGLAVDTVLLAVTLGVIGARLAYILFLPPSVSAFYETRWFFQHPLDMQAGPLAIWTGGLDTAGALIGVGAALWSKGRKFEGGWPSWFGLLLPGTLLAVILLPWGSALAGDLMGPATGWFVGMPSATLDTLTGAAGPYQPLPVYISLFTLFLLILYLFGRLSFQTALMLLFAAWLAVDTLRLDVYRIGGILTPLQVVTFIGLSGLVIAQIGRNPH